MARNDHRASLFCAKIQNTKLCIEFAMWCLVLLVSKHDFRSSKMAGRSHFMNNITIKYVFI